MSPKNRSAGLSRVCRERSLSKAHKSGNLAGFLTRLLFFGPLFVFGEVLASLLSRPLKEDQALVRKPQVRCCGRLCARLACRRYLDGRGEWQLQTRTSGRTGLPKLLHFSFHFESCGGV